MFRKTRYADFDSTITLNYVYRIIRLYIIWTIIYFPWIIYSILNNQNGVLYGLLGWIRRCIFAGSYTQLWYLNATIIATLMLTFFLVQKRKVKTILSFAIVLYIIGLLPQTYFVLLEPLKNIESVWSFLKMVQRIVVTTRNGFFEGFLFMGIGMLFAYKSIIMKFKTAVIGFICSMILFFFESFAVEHLGWAKEHDMYIFLVPTTVLLFYIVSHIELSYSIKYKYLRELGVLIFYLHLFVNEGVARISIRLGGIMDNSLVNFFCTAFLTVMISHCIIVLGNTEKFRWIRKIYV